MVDVLFKLSSDFKVSWNLDSIISKFDKNLDLSESRKVFSDPTGNPHWQNFKSNISFGRNFVKNFPDESKEIADKLIELQHSLVTFKTDNLLLLKFLNHKIDYRRVNLFKVNSKNDVSIHCDTTRGCAINIGYINSNTHETLVSHDPNINNFDNSQKSSYVLNDGDVYIVDVSYPHCVNSLNKNIDLNRYVITYNIEIRI